MTGTTEQRTWLPKGSSTQIEVFGGEVDGHELIAHSRYILANPPGIPVNLYRDVGSRPSRARDTLSKAYIIEQLSRSQPATRIPLSRLAGFGSVTVSDEYSSSYVGSNATDKSDHTDWAARGSDNKWIRLDWEEPVGIVKIALKNRQTGADDPIYEGQLVLSDGTEVRLEGIATHASQTVDIERSNIDWIKYVIVRGKNNVGLSDIEVFGRRSK